MLTITKGLRQNRTHAKLFYFQFGFVYMLYFLRLKGYSTPKWKLCHSSLTTMSSKPVNALLVFGAQFKIFWMKTGPGGHRLSHWLASK